MNFLKPLLSGDQEGNNLAMRIRVHIRHHTQLEACHFMALCVPSLKIFCSVLSKQIWMVAKRRESNFGEKPKDKRQLT